MICVRLFGIELAIDFTAPAFLALMLLLLPAREVGILLSTCVIHESAHFIALALFHRKPACLRISGVGLRLSVPQAALCKTPTLAAILLAGVGANFLAAALLAWAHAPQAAVAHLTMGLFNLLPFRAADGGTLLYALLEQALTARHPAWIHPLWRGQCIVTLLTLALLMQWGGVHNPSLWGMLVFLGLSECLT